MREMPLCPELQALLESANWARATACGREPPHRTDWPDSGSVFVALKHDLRSAVGDLPAAVRHSVCRDPHYGWREACYCEIHRHLLVAGVTKPP
ncbi:hypothetical protein [Xanthomonas theicola]|uniref:Uncharacterized protein n=1 Tax=Xanthomonas theicola TaxID=56464 RepID=A0A2S6ZHX7_9XANT|nr:hypothetical protein [Xanthomonas theicola]PPT91865.1 hypothetical protein XthCFBP4691_06250 [Xanthomonas theicola]QNH23881.1 hypothetical protein G4Q83_02695 [Xanthomonas theicola]